MPEDSVEKRLIQTESLVELSLLINSDLNIERTLDVFHSTVVADFGVSSVAIFLPETFYSTEWELVKGKPETPGALGQMRGDGAIVEHFVKNKFPIRYDELLKVPGVDADELGAYQAKLVAPLFIKSEIVGLLVLGERATEYSPSELELIHKICNIAGTAIENARLFALATFDQRTKLYTYHPFKAELHKEMNRAERYNQPLSLIMFDIDHFKRINDNYGHNQGDEVLRVYGQIIRESVREVDTAARFGGEEFIIACPNSDKDEALKAAKRLTDATRGHTFHFNGDDLVATASFGIALYEKGQSMHQFIEAADQALYASKKAGRDRITLAT